MKRTWPLTVLFGFLGAAALISQDPDASFGRYLVGMAFLWASWLLVEMKAGREMQNELINTTSQIRDHVSDKHAVRPNPTTIRQLSGDELYVWHLAAHANGTADHHHHFGVSLRIHPAEKCSMYYGPVAVVTDDG